MTDSLKTTDAASQAVQKTPNRVALADIEAAIATVEYLTPPKACPEMTICAITMDNGFTVLGQSAPADPANFNAALGRDFAYENAIRQLWPLAGYALRDRMARGI